MPEFNTTRVPGKRKTCRRINGPGHAHALTFSCFQGRPFLSKDRSRMWMVDAIELARDRHRFDLWAWVIMPEHVHLLICPSAEYSISEILSTLKQSVAKKAILWVRSNAPRFLKQMEDRQPNGTVRYRFWQRGGGYDRNLTGQKAILAEIDYFHANPIRRGLCERATEWRWSSAVEHETPGMGLLRLDCESLSSLT